MAADQARKQTMFSSGYGKRDSHSSEDSVTENYMKKKYFDLHVTYNIKDSGCHFFEANLPKKYSEDDVVTMAVDRGIIDASDYKYIDYVIEVTKKAYEQATGKFTPNSIRLIKSLGRKKK